MFHGFPVLPLFRSPHFYFDIKEPHQQFIKGKWVIKIKALTRWSWHQAGNKRVVGSNPHISRKPLTAGLLQQQKSHSKYPFDGKILQEIL